MPSNSNALFQFVEQNLRHLRSALTGLDAESLARQSGFLRRLPRNAAIVGLAAQTPYSKQALHQRLSPQLEQFLAQVAATLFGQLVVPLKKHGWFAAFRRGLLNDTPVEPLPDPLADAFPGPANGRKRCYAALKLQFVCDLLQAKVLH